MKKDGERVREKQKNRIQRGRLGKYRKTRDGSVKSNPRTNKRIRMEKRIATR